MTGNVFVGMGRTKLKKVTFCNDKSQYDVVISSF